MATIAKPKYAAGMTGFYQWFARTYPKASPRLNRTRVANAVKAAVAARVAIKNRAPVLRKAGLAGLGDLGAVNASVTVGAKPATPAKAAAQPWYVTAAQSALSTIKDAFVTKLEYDQQKNLINMQMQRAAQGLPPIDAAAVSPTANVNVGVSPEIQGQMNKMLLVVGLGVGAFVLLGAMKRR